MIVRIIFVCVTVALLVGWGRFTSAQDSASADRVAEERAIVSAFEHEEFAEAERLLSQAVKDRPYDYKLFYNLACAHAMQGEVTESVESLLDALSYGFVDFFHLERDPHLKQLRGNPDYERIVRNWRKLLDARGAAEMAAVQEYFGEEYLYESDSNIRINMASSFKGEQFEQIRDQLRKVEAWAYRSVLPTPPSEMDPKPDPWVTVIVPNPEQFLRLVRALGVGGIYDRDSKRLIAQDIGPSLRHEFFHVLHWRHMDRIGQTHPIWVMEGLAAVLEDVEVSSVGEYVIVPSWRTNIVKRLERAGRLTPWRELFRFDRDRFMSYRSKANYAQARAVFMFLLAEGKLREWYDVFCDNFDEDPSGEFAMSNVFGLPLSQVEQRFREWVRALDFVSEIAHPSDATIGAELSAGRGDGPIVDELVRPRTAAGQAGLRMRDVIVAVNGQPTPTLDDFHRLLGEFEPGEKVVLRVRRGSLVTEFELTLDQRSEDAIFGPAVPGTP